MTNNTMNYKFINQTVYFHSTLWSGAKARIAFGMVETFPTEVGKSDNKNKILAHARKYCIQTTHEWSEYLTANDPQVRATAGLIIQNMERIRGIIRSLE